jgi:hypothetical protein
LLPLVAVSGTEASTDKHYDPITGRCESFRFAAALSPSGSRLHQISLNGLATVVRTTTRKFQGLSPFDVGIKYGDRSVEVTAIKCGIRGTKLRNDFIMYSLTFFRLLRKGKLNDD